MIYFLHRTLLIELGFCTANTRTKRMLRRRRRSPDPPLLIPWITGRSPGLSRERWWWNRYVSEHRQELTTKGFKPVNFGLTKIPHPPPPQTDRVREKAHEVEFPHHRALKPRVSFITDAFVKWSDRSLVLKDRESLSSMTESLNEQMN